MNYSNKYPIAQPYEQPEDGIMLGPTARSCWNCGEITCWIDINFEAYLCSEECRKQKWSEYKNVCMDSRN